MTDELLEHSEAWQDSIALLTGLGLADGTNLRDEAADRSGIYSIVEGLSPSDRDRIGAEAARLDAQLTEMRRSSTKSAKSRKDRLSAANNAQQLNSVIRPLSRIASACGAESWREQSEPDPSAFQEQLLDTGEQKPRSRFGLFKRRTT